MNPRMKRLGLLAAIALIGAIASSVWFLLRTRDQPCVAPCWEDIRPGISDADDVLAHLEASSLVSTSSIRCFSTHQVPCSHFEWRFRNPGSGNAYLEENRVRYVVLWLEGAGVTLGEMVDELGPPEYWDAGFDYPEGDAVVVFYWIGLFYPDQGVQIMALAT